MTLTGAGDRRGARGVDRGRPRSAREGADAGGADGRARQLGRDLLADRPRRGRGARRAGDGRRAARRARVPRGERRRVPGRAAAGRGDDAVGDPRARRGGRGPAARDARPGRVPRRARRRGEDALARTPEQLAVLREAGVVDAGGAGLLEIVRGARRPRVAGEPIPDAPAEDAHEAGVDAVHQELSRVPLLHRLRRRGRGPRRRRARGASSSRSATRCSSSATRARSRCTSTRTTRAPCSLSRTGARRRRGRRDREHAPADRASARSGCSRAPCRIGATRSRPASSRSSRAPATAASSRASAPPG